MQRVVAMRVGCLLGLSWLLFYCLGCASDGVVGKSSDAGGQAQEYSSGKSSSEPVPASKADRVLAVQMQESPEQISIVIEGNGPFRDYQFSRLGERQFALDLADIANKGELPSLPAESTDLRLSYSEASRGVEIIGTLVRPLDHYTLNNIGDNLTLNLYVPGVSGPSDEAASEVSGGSSTVSKNIESSKASEKSNSSRKSSSKPMASQNQLQSVAEDGTTRVAGESPNETVSMEASPLRKKYTGKPISLDLMDADLRNVLRLIADVTGTNFVVEPDVTGKVTMRVEQVPWDQILDSVLSMNNLGKEESGNVIRIAKQTKLSDEWKQREDLIKAKRATLEAAKDSGEITTQYLTVNYAQPAEISTKINEIKSEKGKISIDDRTSMIIYSDYPRRIEDAKSLLARLDKPMPQVMIEARIVSMKSTITRDLGVTWNLNLNDKSALVRDYELNMASAATGGTTDLNLGQVIGQTLLTLDLHLSASEIADQSKVIAAPKVLTLNNVKATITQGTQIPYQSQSAADSLVYSTVFKDAVVELNIVPHITPDKKVRLEIEAKQDEPDTANSVRDQPAISTRKIKTELLVADGGIIVIGGVMRQTKKNTTDTTPGLGRIPILGRLFKVEHNEDTKEELLIFISPKIVEI
ncbi:MAG: secretin and TonB N-terminal domain-containing protein [Syntrophobacteraceae bacterium]